MRAHRHPLAQQLLPGDRRVPSEGYGIATLRLQAEQQVACRVKSSVNTAHAPTDESRVRARSDCVSGTQAAPVAGVSQLNARVQVLIADTGVGGNILVPLRGVF